MQASERVHHHGEEAEDAGDRHLRVRGERVEPGVEDRRERDDRDCVRGDRERHQRGPDGAEACDERGEEDPDHRADDEPLERLLERVPAGRPERAAGCRRGRGRSRSAAAAGTAARGTRRSGPPTATSAATSTRIAGSHSARADASPRARRRPTGAPHRLSAASSSGRSCSPPRRSSSRTSRHELEEPRRLARLDGARVGQVDRHDAG